MRMQSAIRELSNNNICSSSLMKAFNAADGHGLGLFATNGGELAEAIEKSLAHTGGPALIECVIDRDDCTRELLE